MHAAHPDPSRSSSAALPTRITDLIKVELSSGSESHFFAGLGGDVSRGGVFIATYRSVAVGDSLLVELHIEDAVVVAPGTVKWRTPGGSDLPPGVGVVLRDLTDADRKVIERFCARRPPFYFDLGDRASVSDEGDLRALAPRG